MCGIAGYVDLAGLTDRGVAHRMAEILSHRGPDEQRSMHIGPAGLAHARLSIIDLAASHQPMCSGNRGLVFNGEIYNYQELRGRLAPPPQGWCTSGDTEALLQLLIQRGSAGLPEIEGMFAFALWNDDAKRLTMGRDFFGKKPLYYTSPRSDLVVFASEPKAVLVHPEVSASIDLRSLRSVLEHRAVYGSGSMFEQIKQVEPGTVLTWTVQGFKLERFFELASLLEPDAGSPIGERVLTSVRERLVADVPVGAFLSGGIDSSLIVAAMSKLHVSDIHTYSVSFEDDPHDEHPYASSVAARCGATHTRCRVGVGDFVERIGRLSYLRDAPLSEPADVAVSVLSETARRDVKVVLSGEGADEAFAGYPKYSVAALGSVKLAVLRNLPLTTACTMLRAMGISDRRYQTLTGVLRSRTELEAIKRWFAVGGSDVLHGLFPALWNETEDRAADPQEDAWREASRTTADRVQRMQYVDLATWLPGNLLERGDRMSMAHGLEVRMPFMSRAIQGAGLRLPTPEKVRGQRTKLPLRRLAREWIGPDIGSRKKWGFRVPLDAWFRGDLGNVLRRYLEESNSAVRAYGDVTVAIRMLEQHAAGSRDWSMVLWTILTIEAWYSSLDRSMRQTGRGQTTYSASD